jgi:hypothetical protein
MRITKLLALLIILLLAPSLGAQTPPTVGIVLSQPNARLGDIVSAEVWVRGATKVGDIDIGITVDEECLRIIDSQLGTFFPMSEASVASPLVELNEHEARLAAALPDGGEHPSGDGIFYTLQLEVICGQGEAGVNIISAKLISFGEPIDGDVSRDIYTLEAGTLNAISTRLEIVPEGDVAPVATSVPAVTGQAPQAPAMTLLPTEMNDMPLDQRLLLTIVCIGGLTLFGLIILFILSRRHERADRVQRR